MLANALLAAVALNGWTLGLSTAVALSAVALIGYLFGRSQKTEGHEAPSQAQLQRAMRIAQQLELIADDLRQELARHRNRVDRFKTELRRAEGDESEDAWRRLRQEADGMVGPTLRLVGQLSTAYDRIRQQSQSLANFTGGRTDPLTGLANSRSLEEHLEVLLSSRAPGSESSAVIVSTDRSDDADRETHERRVRQVGQHLARRLRGDDFAARYGVDEFVVVLPATRLAGASVFGARLRKVLQEDLGVSVCCGLAESMPADTCKSLLARADSAAYSARATGPGQQYRHTGAALLPDEPTAPSAGTEPGAAPPGPDAAATGETTIVEAAAADPLGPPADPLEPTKEPTPEPPLAPVTAALAGPDVVGELYSTPAG